MPISTIHSADIVSYWELSTEWQKEADSNLDSMAEETMYIEPQVNANPQEHVLWDLSEVMRGKGIFNGFRYNATIGISNNSAMLLDVLGDGEAVRYIYV